MSPSDASCPRPPAPPSLHRPSSGTVDCAQVWLVRPRESIGLKGECPQSRRRGRGGGEALTGVQAVVAVGILHLRQQGRNPSDFCPCVCVHARTHLGCAGSCRVPPEPRAARPREHHPSAGRRLLTPRPQPSSPVPSHPRAHASGVFPPWHTRGASCLLCSPGARRAGGALGTAGSPLVFRTPYVPEPAPPSPRRRARPRGLP